MFAGDTLSYRENPRKSMKNIRSNISKITLSKDTCYNLDDMTSTP